MSRKERIELLRRIEDKRNSRILVYITGDRRGLETKIAFDAFPFCLSHLSRMGRQERIDLCLYSTGGITMAGYALVNVVREFCDFLGVIVPFKALSCATLITLGADEILMTKMGQLSPIDPSVISPLGPQVPVPGPPGATQVLPVNVEDAISYLDLARRELALKDEDSLVRIFDRLAQNVHPLTLGSVNRIREQISFLARTLLSRHMKDQQRIENIVETITRGRFSHDYIIGRREAKEVLGLNVVDVPAELDDSIMGLYYKYDGLLQLSTPYHPETVLGQSDVAIGNFDRAIIESDNMTYVFRTKKDIKRVLLGPPQVPATTVAHQERILSEGWVEDNNL